MSILFCYLWMAVKHMMTKWISWLSVSSITCFVLDWKTWIMRTTCWWRSKRKQLNNSMYRTKLWQCHSRSEVTHEFKVMKNSCLIVLFNFTLWNIFITLQDTIDHCLIKVICRGPISNYLQWDGQNWSKFYKAMHKIFFSLRVE